MNWELFYQLNKAAIDLYFGAGIYALTYMAFILFVKLMFDKLELENEV